MDYYYFIINLKALPHETRVEQASIFNDINSGYDILIATDAGIFFFFFLNKV
jgi:hypothetical protein